MSLNKQIYKDLISVFIMIELSKINSQNFQIELDSIGIIITGFRINFGNFLPQLEKLDFDLYGNFVNSFMGNLQGLESSIKEVRNIFTLPIIDHIVELLEMNDFFFNKQFINNLEDETLRNAFLRIYDGQRDNITTIIGNLRNFEKQ